MSQSKKLDDVKVAEIVATLTADPKTKRSLLAEKYGVSSGRISQIASAHNLSRFGKHKVQPVAAAGEPVTVTSDLEIYDAL